ncbi:FAD-dependent monooxygenase [Microbispora sp. H10836]|uniref:FAD-dependent oxidoreductase n=1 Tax=Microbispora sp. H10836 TaxID=2729106 RepID=UPI0028937E54|nr:FAD-dependent monooxygenase [Microbispora sp. H10836]
MSFLEAWFHDVATRHPDIAELVGQGGDAAADGERGLFAQRNSGDHIRVYIIQRVPADWITRSGLTPQATDGIRALLLERYRDWSPRLRRLITDNYGPYVDRPIFALPVPHVWAHNPTVTLLGDAAHLMPPLGVDVNLAMLDACELALAIAHHDTVDEAVHAYEKTMLPRSTEMARLLDGAADGRDPAVPGDAAVHIRFARRSVRFRHAKILCAIHHGAVGGADRRRPAHDGVRRRARPGRAYARGARV